MIRDNIKYDEDRVKEELEILSHIEEADRKVKDSV
jgi:hypothetical protein